MLKEYLDMATILAGAKTNEEIAYKLKELGVLCPPCKTGDEVYFLAVRSMWGTILTSGYPVKRVVDKISWDGNEFTITSFARSSSDPTGTLYGVWGKEVFETQESAAKRLEEIRKKAGI